MFKAASIILLLALLSPTLSAPVDLVSARTPFLPSTLVSREACSSDVKALVSGINKNIAVQKDEAAQNKIIQKVLAADTIDKSDFDSAKSKLVDIVNKGIGIRENNQAILPSGNAAADGLKKVATAQKGELKLAQGLTGKPDTDNPNLDKLATMFSGGIKQNQQNAKDAASGCTIDN